MILVIGLGFVGLTTALGLSEKGNTVYAYDIDIDKINLIQNKKIPFYEAGLQEILNKNLNKNFFLTKDIKEVIDKVDVIILCVGTPSGSNGEADLSYIKSAIDDITQSMGNSPKIVVIKSTIPPSTTEQDIIPYIQQQGKIIGKDIFIANNPEFLREGHAWDDFINPDRIVIGAEDTYTKNSMKEIYKNFGVPIHFVSLNTGEFIKYLSNSFLATLISYSNEMSMIAAKIGNIDIKKAFEIFHQDKRWYGEPANMQTYAFPGCGFGGYCLPKDTLALAQKAKKFDIEPQILDSVLSVNKNIKEYWIEKITNKLSLNTKITILGLAFKSGSDDVRQTPAAYIIEGILKKGYKNLTAYDEIGISNFKKMYNFQINYTDNLEQAVEDSDVIVITSNSQEFVKINTEDKTVFDLRYIL